MRWLKFQSYDQFLIFKILRVAFFHQYMYHDLWNSYVLERKCVQARNEKEDVEKILIQSDSDIEDTKQDIIQLEHQIGGLEMDSKSQINILIGKVKSLKKDKRNLQKELAFVESKTSGKKVLMEATGNEQL